MAGMNLVSGQFLSIDGTAGAPAWAFTGDATLGISRPAANTLGVSVAGVVMAKFGAGGSSKMSQGLSLIQSAYDDNILEFTSADVIHGMTTIQDTNVFGAILKADPTKGGVLFWGMTEHTVNAFRFRAVTTGLANKDKDAGAWAGIMMEVSRADGTGTQAYDADGNLVAIRDHGSTVFIFDKEGSAHALVEWVAMDKYDDLMMIRDMEQVLLDRETEAQTYRRHALEDAGIIGRGSWCTETGKLKAMVNTSKLAMLHHGALIQSAERIAQLESRIEELEQRGIT